MPDDEITEEQEKLIEGDALIKKNLLQNFQHEKSPHIAWLFVLNHFNYSMYAAVNSSRQFNVCCGLLKKKFN